MTTIEQIIEPCGYLHHERGIDDEYYTTYIDKNEWIANENDVPLYAEPKPAQMPDELVRSVELLMENSEEYNGVFTVFEHDFNAVSNCLDNLDKMKGGS